MAIGEAGVAVNSNTPAGSGSNPDVYEVEVILTEPLTDPIIVLNSTNEGGNKFSLRITGEETDSNGDTISFTFTFDEYEYEDGPHPAQEQVQWLAIEEGTHTLPDGRVIHAGETVINPGDTSVEFAGDPFDPSLGSDDIVVLTTMSGDNATNAYGPADGVVVDAHPYGVDASGFDIDLLRSEDAAGGGVTVPKTVGFIAIEVGNANGTPDADAASAQIEDGLDEDGDDQNIYTLTDFFTDPVVLAETQSQIVDDPNNSGGENTDNNSDTNPDSGTVLVDGVTADNGGVTTVDLEFEQTDQVDSSGTTDKTVGIVAFEDGLIMCFGRGTRILTDHGPRPVEELTIGDLVVTKDKGLQPIRWIGGKAISAQQMAENPALHPVEIPKDAFGPGVPERPIKLSQQHRVVFENATAELLFGSREVFVPAKCLRAATSQAAAEPIEYFHILFDEHQIVYANGLECDSLHPGHLTSKGLDPMARDELFTIFPELRAHPEEYGPACRRVLKYYEAHLLAHPMTIH